MKLGPLDDARRVLDRLRPLDRKRAEELAAEIAKGPLEPRRGQRDVGLRPRLPEVRVRLRRLRRLALRAQALREPEQRPAVAGVALEIVAIDLLGLRGACRACRSTAPSAWRTGKYHGGGSVNQCVSCSATAARSSRSALAEVAGLRGDLAGQHVGRELQHVLRAEEERRPCAPAGTAARIFSSSPSSRRASPACPLALNARPRA